jgi:predicted 2-oxoglutarate/Fe(II)-dependent dioxygenase YbiX
VTHIKYEEGGFFKRHRDYLSTTSNLIEEYTLLLCVTPQGADDDDAVKNKGGETIIHTYGGATAYDTTTTGSGILFRKDLLHEGNELISGEKHIITANIWAMRKEQSKQVLLVTFPQEGKEGEGRVKYTCTCLMPQSEFIPQFLCFIIFHCIHQMILSRHH